MNDAIYSTQRAFGVLLAMAGMTLQWTCLHAVTFSASIFPVAGEAQAAVWPINSLVTFSIFIAIFCTNRQGKALVERRGFLMAGGVCLPLSFAAFAAAGLLMPTPIALGATSAFMACATTPLIVMWGEMFRLLDPKAEQLFVTLGGIVCSVALYLTMVLLPAPLAVVLFILVPFGSLLCLAKARVLLEELSHSWVPHAHESQRRSPALLYVCIVAFSIPCSYLRGNLEIQAVLRDIHVWTGVLAVTVIVMIALALLEVVAERHKVLLVPSAVLFLLIAAMLIHLLPGEAAGITPYLLYAGYYMFLAMIYLALGPAASIPGSNPTRLFSGAMIANVGGLLVGTCLGILGKSLGDSGMTVIVLAVTCVIFMAGVALYSNRSYSVFRVNYYDEDEYSFEYSVPLVPVNATVLNAPEGNESMLDAITRRCDGACERYGLSLREGEVLVELARGRTIATIAGKLVVSENTVKAHTKAIYRKLDVHTREELLARIEEG